MYIATIHESCYYTIIMQLLLYIWLISPLPLCFVDYKAGEEWHRLPLYPCKSGEQSTVDSVRCLSVFCAEAFCSKPCLVRTVWVKGAIQSCNIVLKLPNLSFPPTSHLSKHSILFMNLINHHNASLNCLSPLTITDKITTFFNGCKMLCKIPLL